MRSCQVIISCLTVEYRHSIKLFQFSGFFSDRARLKLEVLDNHEIATDSDFVTETVRLLDKLETGEEKQTAQKRLNENLVLRVVYRICCFHFNYHTLSR